MEFYQDHNQQYPIEDGIDYYGNMGMERSSYHGDQYNYRGGMSSQGYPSHSGGYRRNYNPRYHQQQQGGGGAPYQQGGYSNDGMMGTPNPNHGYSRYNDGDNRHHHPYARGDDYTGNSSGSMRRPTRPRYEQPSAPVKTPFGYSNYDKLPDAPEGVCKFYRFNVRYIFIFHK